MGKENVSFEFLQLVKFLVADLTLVDPMLLDLNVLGTFLPTGFHMLLGISLSFEPLIAAGALPVIFSI